MIYMVFSTRLGISCIIKCESAKLIVEINIKTVVSNLTSHYCNITLLT